MYRKFFLNTIKKVIPIGRISRSSTIVEDTISYNLTKINKDEVIYGAVVKKKKKTKPNDY